ncbi:hypothetical protein ACLKA7_011119 [Drosophila subpalustris]
MPQRTPSPVQMIASRSCSSPAVSEISVGSPSPPPMAMRPLNIKRLRLLRSPATIQSGRKCSQPTPGERIKSFSIADILGRSEDRKAATPAPTVLLHERLQAPPAPTAVATPMAAPLLHPGLHPFLPPALLHSYEQRLAWDYQRQLQEHFQAQLLRQMSMDPAIIPIPSEDGSSERSQRSSSSNGSTDCCTPNQSTSNRENDEKTKQTPSDPSQKTGAGPGGDTPLDALFQLSTKNFDEEQDPANSNHPSIQSVSNPSQLISEPRLNCISCEFHKKKRGY